MGLWRWDNEDANAHRTARKRKPFGGETKGAIKTKNTWVASKVQPSFFMPVSFSIYEAPFNMFGTVAY